MDQSVKKWNRDTGECLQTVVRDDLRFIFQTMAFSPGADYALVGRVQRPLEYFPLSKGYPAKVMVNAPVRSITFSHDGLYALFGSQADTKIFFMDVSGSDAKVIAELKGFKGGVTAVALSADGSVIVGGDEYGTLRMWRLPIEHCMPEYIAGTIDSVKALERGGNY